MHGFLGPNGSGKTTTLRVLLGLLRADAGTVVLLGGDPRSDAVELHRRLAYVPGDVTLWPKLSGGEVIDLFGRLRGDYSRPRRDELIERFQLDPTKKARTYSKGNRQGLIAALASSAELLILDEPTCPRGERPSRDEPDEGGGEPDQHPQGGGVDERRADQTRHDSQLSPNRGVAEPRPEARQPWPPVLSSVSWVSCSASPAG